MLALGGEGGVEVLRDLNIVPLTISYEYDPCDYLKAQEFQQKRDNPGFRKSQKDDLLNMKTGIMGFKGRIHYEAAPCINEWLGELSDLPRTEVFGELARRMDAQIHGGYRLFPCNYVAYDELNGTKTFCQKYSEEESQAFDCYVEAQLDKVSLPNPDRPYLRERMLTMYANPVVNKEKQ